MVGAEGFEGFFGVGGGEGGCWVDFYLFRSCGRVSIAGCSGVYTYPEVWQVDRKVVIGISSRARFGDMWSRTSLRLSDVLCAVTLTSSRSMAVVYVLGSP